MKRKSLKKSIWALTASLSMVVSSFCTDGLTAFAEGTNVAETVYIDENFDSYGTGRIIASGTTAPDPVDKGQLTFKAGARSGGNIKCYADIVETDEGKYLKIDENEYANYERGISFTFNYTEAAPTMEELKEAGTVLECCMDIETGKDVTVTGFGVIPAGTDGHVQLILDAVAGLKHIIVTSESGKLISSTTEEITEETGFEAVTFFVADTKATLDNIKVVQKPVDIGEITITVTGGEEALADAEVTIGKCIFTTDENGQVKLFLPNGDHKVVAAKAGYEFTEGGEDNAVGTVTVASAPQEFTLALQVMKYLYSPKEVTVAAGQTVVIADSEEAVITDAFTVSAVDQLGDEISS